MSQSAIAAEVAIKERMDALRSGMTTRGRVMSVDDGGRPLVSPLNPNEGGARRMDCLRGAWLQPGDDVLIVRGPDGSEIALDALRRPQDPLGGAAGQAYLASSQRFDSRAYASLNDAIRAAHDAGGGEVFVAEPPPPGSDIILMDKVYLVGRGSGATELDIGTITGSGSVVELPALGANIARHSRIVTFTAAHGLTPGDVFILWDSTDSSFSTARPYYRAGEMCRVMAVSGTSVLLTKPTYAAYTAGGTVTAAKMLPLRAGISGMTIHCTTGKTGIRFDLATNLIFDDLVMDGSNISHLTLSRCYDVTIRGVSAFDVQPATTPGLNYGICLLNCQKVQINDAMLETRRHGLTMGGDDALYGVPNRDIWVHGGSISGMSEVVGVCGCNMHGNSEDVHFRDVAMPAGFNPAGDNVTVKGCVIGSAAWGGAVGSMELLGADITFEGNTIRANANHPPDRGLIYILFDTYTKRNFGRLRFINNDIDLGPYGWAGATAGAYGIYVLVNADGVPDSLEVEARGNQIRTTQVITANHYAIRVRAAGGLTTFGIGRYDAIDNITDMPIVQTNIGTTRMHFVGDVLGAPTFLAGKGSMCRRKDGSGANTTLYINETGTTTWRGI